ncbi:non-ribosomal peptide synthetase [Streptomyces olivochromogenes]|uniref:non-ribosomal peptide synthetase n=1 Tax=Streptomyces olivochromogenes TaxID=1963 RepID=UPI001F1756BD|nr:non-ribosomal peptide synthetase [Streptomyces olivochromogenes]MCF3135099.1 amino acid adenylation domain-containing protein [Streptomyces olivochromogenes]
MSPAPSPADRFAALGGEQRVRLLRRLVESGRADSVPAVVPPRDPDAPVVLSPAQEDLWVYESLYPGTGALNICCAYDFDEPVDPADLEEALTLVRERHDVLRTRIRGEAGDLRVDFPPTGRFTLERVDLRATVRELPDLLGEFATRPFDLRSDQLMRGWFVTVDERRSTLMLSLHHIITDWWSFDVLHTAFAGAYRALREGTRTDTGRPKIQYADFAAWQRELDAAGVFGERLGFWRRHLAAPPGPLTVPGFTGRGEGVQIAQLPFRVDAETEAAVRALARSRGTTVYGVLMAAFAVFAHRITTADDLVIGTPTANRAARGLERVIGYVMNSVPTRWRFTPGTSFAETVDRFAADFPRILANADVPVGRIVSEVAPERTAGRSPLYQWVFMHLPQQQSVARLREFTEPRRVETGGEHDLVGSVQESDEGMTGAFEVRTSVYPADLAAHWAACFPALLRRLVTDPEAPVNRHQLLPRERIPGSLSSDGARARTPEDGPGALTLPALVERHAERRPDAVAVESAELSLTYRELNDRVGRLARRLVESGAGPETVVALALGRSVSMAVAALAVQRAGAAFLPLDAGYPKERLCYVLEDAAPRLLVTDAATASALPRTGVPVLVLDDTAYDGEPLPARPAEPSAAAYVTYTSGSTGRPKGVVVTHEGIADLAGTLADRMALDEDSRTAQLGSPAFDIYVFELCMAFGAGGTLVVPGGGPLVAEALGEALRDLRVTAAIVPPSVLAGVPPERVPGLRSLAVGGEACPPETAASWAAPGRRLCNAYGPTETTVAATVSDPLPGDGSVPPVGRPVTGTRVYVLDPWLRPVPVGVRGEVYVAGAGVARGYLGRAGLTATRFTADPYGPPGTRLYRTGDLGRWRADGQLEFAGRADDQIKLHGLRIEPGEIEAVLAEHESVSRAVVLLREDTPGAPRLVGYVVPHTADGTAPAERSPDAPAADLTAELAAHCAARLPAHMVPAVLVPLDRLPVTEHGKLDRAALPAPASLAPGANAAPRAPRSPHEKALCELFASVLGLESVGPDDSFFDLGGDSIAALQLVSRAGATAGLSLTPAEVWEARTPAALSALARVPAAADVGEELGRFLPTPVMRWLAELEDADVPGFTLSLLVPTPEGLDLARVAGAVRSLPERHPVLRMRLVRLADGDWEFDVPPAAAAEAPVTRVDAAGLPDEDLRAAAHTAAPGVRLDPYAGELLSAVWYDAGPGRAGQLLLTLHHLAVDGVSCRLLAEELTALLGGTKPPSTTPGTSFRRWSELLHTEARQPERAEAELPYWKRTLTGTVPLRTEAVRKRRTTVTLALPVDRTEPLLTEVPAALGCGPDAVLLAALTAAVTRRRGAPGDLLVELEGHGRQPWTAGADVSRTTGWFTAPYPVRLESGTEAFWADDAAALAAALAVHAELSGVPAGGIGWGLLRHLNPDTAAELAGLPDPSVRFNYLGRISGLDLIGSSESALPLAHALEIDVAAEEETDGTARLVSTWSFAEDEFPADEIRGLAGLWADALDVLLAATARGGTGD